MNNQIYQPNKANYGESASQLPIKLSLDGKEWLKNNLDLEVETIIERKNRPSSAARAGRNLNKVTSSL